MVHCRVKITTNRQNENIEFVRLERLQFFKKEQIY